MLAAVYRVTLVGVRFVSAEGTPFKKLADLPGQDLTFKIVRSDAKEAKQAILDWASWEDVSYVDAKVDLDA